MRKFAAKPPPRVRQKNLRELRLRRTNLNVASGMHVVDIKGDFALTESRRSLGGFGTAGASGMTRG